MVQRPRWPTLAEGMPRIGQEAQIFGSLLDRADGLLRARIKHAPSSQRRESHENRLLFNRLPIVAARLQTSHAFRQHRNSDDGGPSTLSRLDLLRGRRQWGTALCVRGLS